MATQNVPPERPRERGLARWFSALETLALQVSAVAVIVMMMLVTTEVLSRYFLNKPIPGQKEITEMLMVFSVFLAMAYTQRERGHIGMDLVLQRFLEGRLRVVVEFVTALFSLLVTLLITYYGFQRAVDAANIGITSIYLRWPMWPLPLMVGVGSLSLAIRFCIDLALGNEKSRA